MAHLGRGEREAVARFADRLAAVAVDADSPFLAFSAVWMSALAEIHGGDLDASLIRMRRALETASSPFQLAQASALIGVVHVVRGEAAPAIAMLAPVVGKLEQRQEHIRAFFLAYLAQAHLLAGDPVSARDHALEARSLGSSTRHRLAHALATRVLAHAALALGDRGDARPLLEEAVQVFESIPASQEAARTRQDLVRMSATPSPA